MGMCMSLEYLHAHSRDPTEYLFANRKSLGYEEDGQSGIVLAGRYVMKGFLQAIDLCIANVRSIEEGEQVQDTKLFY